MCKNVNFEIKGTAMISAKLVTVNTENEVVINRVIKNETLSIISNQAVITTDDHYITVIHDKNTEDHILSIFKVIDRRNEVVNEGEDIVVIDGMVHLVLVKKSLTQLSRDRLMFCKVLSIIDEAKYIARHVEVQPDDALEAN